MGSVVSDGEDEFQRGSTKKYKLSRKFTDDNGVVNHAAVPRKLRSALKKRSRESITPPMPISGKSRHVSDGVELHRQCSSKKSKKKRGRITKDEEEVAETLNALAGMFSDANKTNKSESDGKSSEPDSSDLPGANASHPASKDIPTLVQGDECGEINKKVNFDASHHSSNSSGSLKKVVKSNCSNDAQQSKLPFWKQSSVADASTVISDRNFGQRQLRMSTTDKTPNGEHAAIPKQISAVGIPNWNPYTIPEDKNNGLFLWPGLSSNGVQGSQTQGPSTQCPAWLENIISTTQPHSHANSATPEKDIQPQVESKKSWKRCSAHVYISRLIQVMQITDRKDESLEKPTESAPDGGLKLETHLYSNCRTSGINGHNGVDLNNNTLSAADKSFAEIQKAILLHKRLLQDQQQPSTSSEIRSSNKQGSDFLSLASGEYGLEGNGRINKSGPSQEPSRKFHISHLQSQNYAASHFPFPPHKSYSSGLSGHPTTAAQKQIELPPYLSSNLGGLLHTSGTAPVRQQSKPQYQKWISQIPTPYNLSEVLPTNLSDWKDRTKDPSLLNCGHTLFPNLNSSVFPQQQQQQLMHINPTMRSQDMKRQYHLFPSSIERSGTTFLPDNPPRLELMCRQHF